MKKGILKKVLCLSCSILLALSALNFGACGGGSGGTASNTLNISIVKMGFGVDWLYALEEAFEQKTGIDVDVQVKIGSSGQSAFDSELQSLSSDTDLFFTKRAWFAQDVYKGKITAKGKTYNCLYEDLTDVWNSKVDEGSELTIKDKMSTIYKDALDIEGKYYNLPWAGGVYGICRNLNVWESLKLTEEDVPYTTDELFALCDKVKAEEVAPFIYSKSDEYYIGWSPIFFGQYEGVENVEKFMSGKDPDGNVTENVYTYTGQVKAMEILNRLVMTEGYQHRLSTSIDFTTMQGHFLNGQALFCINGSWLENEMGANFKDAKVDMIRTPVLSSLVERLSFNSDEKLVEVIKYVDAVDAGEQVSKPADVTEEDIRIVTEARHYSYLASGVDHRAYVPSYSKHVDNAKEFLKFMYSDEGLNIYYNTLNGTMLPATPINGYTNTQLSLSGFRVSVNNAEKDAFLYDREPKARYFVIHKVSTCFENGGDPFQWMYDGVSAQEIITRNRNEVLRKWPKISEALGLD